MGDLANEFSWSRSRDGAFQECMRRYFSHSSGAGGGWAAAVAPEVRRLYILKQLASGQQWAGRTVHDAIELALHGLRDGRSMPVEPFVADVIERMRGEWRSSRDGRYREIPKTTALFEHEYQVDLKPEAWQALRENVATCLRNFFRLPLLAEIRRTSPEHWSIEHWSKVFDFEGTQVWVAPDLGFWTSDGRPELRSPRGPAGEEARALHGQDRLAPLIDRLVTHADHATVGFARRRPDLEHLAARGDRVAGAYGLEPADLVDAGRAHARHAMDQALDGEPERDADRLPAARDQASVDRGRGSGLVHVEGLRVVLLPEGDDLVAREGVRAELERVARLEILEIEGHGPAAYPVRRDGVNVTGSDRTPRNTIEGSHVRSPGARARSPRRRTAAAMAIWPSSRASGAPTQKWAP